MRIQVWTPTFKHEEETPIVLVWVTLSKLPWHCYNKDFITTLIASIGKVLYLDTTSIQKTIGSMAKVKVQIKLIKARPPHIWMGFDEKDLTVGR